MATVPTYVLAPNFTFHPDTSICMGDIIDDPTDPTRPLSSPPTLPDIEHHIDYDAEFSKEDNQSLRTSIWAKFLENVVEARAGGGVTSDLLTKYTMKRLETVYFKKQPTDEEAAERAKDKKVQAAINSGILRKNPVYMISGLKIARGFRLSKEATSTQDGDVSVSAQVSPDANVGAELAASHKKAVKQSHRAGKDIIFAYQLHIIAHKGWRQNKTDIRVHKPKAAFLHEGDKKSEEEPVEVSAATEGDLRQFDEEMSLKVLEATNENETYNCVVFQEEFEEEGRDDEE